MKRIIIPILTAVIALPAAAAKRMPDVGVLPATVEYITDGDTFRGTVSLQSGLKASLSIRFMNIDTPEISGLCENERKKAEAAKARLAELMPVGTRVVLRKIKDDKYPGRIDAFVIKDGEDIGEILIYEGHARRYSGGKRQPWCSSTEIAREENETIEFLKQL